MKWRRLRPGRKAMKEHIADLRRVAFARSRKSEHTDP